MKPILPFPSGKGYFPVLGPELLDLAIDPGKHTGWACFHAGTFHKGTLVGCGVGKPPRNQIQRLVIELPQVYPQHPVPPNDLITLSFLAGRLVGASGLIEVYTVSPHEWKGNLPKDVCARRVRGQLLPEELKVLAECEKVVPKGQMHNVMDAIGIGLFAFRSSGEIK